MKRFFLLLCTVLMLFLFVSCGKVTAYEPNFSCIHPFSYENGKITGTVYTLDTLHLRELVETEDDLLLTADFSADYYSEDGEIPLQEGTNEMVLTFMGEEGEAKVPVIIEVILLKDLRVEMLSPEKTYHIGESFDKSTVAVIGVKKDGTEVTVSDYVPEYEFSALGAALVGIEVGGHYESFSVSVTEEYLPTLNTSHEADGVTYVIRDGEATLAYAENVSGFFAVPRVVLFDGAEYPVTEIGVGAFEGTQITGVQIPEGVLRIADSAFADTIALEWIELPDTLASIGKLAFLGCSSLKRITLPDGIHELATGTFRGCESLFRAELPEGLTAIGKDAFFGCESLVSIAFPASLDKIGESAFEGCKKLESAVIGSLALLDDRAFADCASLSAFVIGVVDTVGADIFAGASPVLYVADAAAFSTIHVEKHTVSNEITIIECPKTFAIEDGFPDTAFLAVYTEDGIMKTLRGFTVSYPEDACGALTATLAVGDISLSLDVFVTYTEPLALDTDSRGAVYSLDPATMTAALVSLPEYARRSQVYRPHTDGLFLVPTHLSREDGIYTVTEMAEDAAAGCLNVTEIRLPR